MVRVGDRGSPDGRRVLFHVRSVGERNDQPTEPWTAETGRDRVRRLTAGPRDRQAGSPRTTRRSSSSAPPRPSRSCGGPLDGGEAEVLTDLPAGSIGGLEPSACGRWVAFTWRPPIRAHRRRRGAQGERRLEPCSRSSNRGTGSTVTATSGTSAGPCGCSTSATGRCGSSTTPTRAGATSSPSIRTAPRSPTPRIDRSGRTSSRWPSRSAWWRSPPGGRAGRLLPRPQDRPALQPRRLAPRLRRPGRHHDAYSTDNPNSSSRTSSNAPPEPQRPHRLLPPGLHPRGLRGVGLDAQIEWSADRRVLARSAGTGRAGSSPSPSDEDQPAP